MAALSKLVNASIAALRNAANAGNNNSSNGYPSQQQGSMSRSNSNRPPGPPRVPVQAPQQPLISQWDER